MGAPALTGATPDTAPGQQTFRRIAVEEAFSTPELMAAQRRLLASNPPDEPGFTRFWGTMADSASASVGHGQGGRSVCTGLPRV